LSDCENPNHDCWGVGELCNSSCLFSSRSDPSQGYIGYCGSDCDRTSFDYYTFSGNCSEEGSGTCYVRGDSLGTVYTNCELTAFACGHCTGSGSYSCSSYSESTCNSCSGCTWTFFFTTWICAGTTNCNTKGFVECVTCGCSWQTDWWEYIASNPITGYGEGYSCTWLE